MILRCAAAWRRPSPPTASCVVCRLRPTSAAASAGALEISLIAEGHTVAASWPGPLAAARNQPLTIEVLREQLGRLGDTPFELADVTIDLPDAVMAPRSVLNDLRRRLVAELIESRQARYPIVDADALEGLRSETDHSPPSPPALRGRGVGVRGTVWPQWRAIGATPSPLTPTPLPPQSRGEREAYGEVALQNDGVALQNGGLALHVLVRSMGQLDAALAFRPATVYCDFEDVRRYRDAVSRARAAGVPVGLATLRVVKPGEEGFLHTIGAAGPDFVLVRNLAALELFREQFPHIGRVGDFALNIANELTADLFLGEGLERIVPSYDLNWEQFAALARHIDPARLEAVVHQHMPMFHNEHCVFAATLSNGKDHRDCGRPCDRHRVELRDRTTGSVFPLVADAGCRNTVFNAVPQSAAEYLPRMRALGLRHFRVELLRESAAEATALLERYRRVLAGEVDGRDLWRDLRALNQLGVTRGTLQVVISH